MDVTKNKKLQQTNEEEECIATCSGSSSSDPTHTSEILALRESIRQSHLALEKNRQEWNEFVKKTEDSLNMWRERIKKLTCTTSTQPIEKENLAEDEYSDEDSEADFDPDDGEDIVDAEEATGDCHSEENLSIEDDSGDSYSYEGDSNNYLSSQTTLTANSHNAIGCAPNTVSHFFERRSVSSPALSNMSTLYPVQNASGLTINQSLHSTNDNTSNDNENSPSLCSYLEQEDSYQESNENLNDELKKQSELESDSARND